MIKLFIRVLGFILLPIIWTTEFAHAQVAANSLLSNQTTVSYRQNGIDFVIQQTLNISIDLVTCAPQITWSNQSVNYMPGQATNLTATLRSCANGLDSYTFNTQINSQTNNDGLGQVTSGANQTLDLGASVVLSQVAANELALPFDQVNDGFINGLAVGDTIEVNSEIRQIVALTDTVTNSSIVLDSDLTNAPTTGMPVVEIATLTFAVNPGVITDATVALTTDIQIQGLDSSGGETLSLATVSFLAGSAHVQKLMRNVTTILGHATATGETELTVNGQTQFYYDGNVVAAPDDVIEYIVSVENRGTAPLMQSILEEHVVTGEMDIIPIVSNIQAVLMYDSATWTYLSFTTSDRYQQQTNAVENREEILVDLGTGYTPGNGGEIAPGETWALVYRVRVQ